MARDLLSQNGESSSEDLEGEEDWLDFRDAAAGYSIGQNGVREEPQDQQYAALDTDSDSSEDAEDVRADYAQLNQNVTSTDGENRQPDETAAQNQLQSERVNNARNADTDEVRQRAWWTATQLTRDGSPAEGANGLQHQAEPSPEDIQLDQEKKAAIIGAMKNVKLEYVPPWATRISETDFSTQVGVLAAARKQFHLG